jgi:VWFA-related protein
MQRVWLLLASLPLLSQQEPLFRSDTTLATVAFHVVRDKHYVDDLKIEDLVLLEDGVPRKITFFEGGRGKQRTTAVDLLLLFDVSGSVVDNGLLDMTTWKDTFLDVLPGTSLAVYGFDSRLLRFCPPSRDARQLAAAFNSVLKTSKSGPKVEPAIIPLSVPPKRKSSMGGTWIYEAVIAAVNEAAAWPGKSTRLILIFSDGFPTTTSLPEDAGKIARDTGIAIYPVALGHQRLIEKVREVQPRLYSANGAPNDGAQRRMDDLRRQEQEIMDFASLGELTGGRSFDPLMMNSDTLRRIATSMVGSVLTEYVVGFSPEPGASPVRHKLVVKLAAKDTGKLAGGTRIIVH